MISVSANIIVFAIFFRGMLFDKAIKRGGRQDLDEERKRGGRDVKSAARGSLVWNMEEGKKGVVDSGLGFHTTGTSDRPPARQERMPRN